MYILNISKAIKKMSINEIKDFIFENYYKRIGFSKESSNETFAKKRKLLLVNKLIEKIPGTSLAKVQY